MLPFLLPFTLFIAFFRQLWLLFKKLEYRALLYWVGIILLTGTLFYNRIEGWSLLDSFYFSVITLTTIGYGDLTPTQPISKLFTICYIFIGLSILLAFINQLAGERLEIHSGRFRQPDNQDKGSGKPNTE